MGADASQASLDEVIVFLSLKYHDPAVKLDTGVPAESFPDYAGTPQPGTRGMAKHPDPSLLPVPGMAENCETDRESFKLP